MSKDRIKDLEKNPSWANVSYRRVSRQFVDHEDQIEAHNTHPQSTTINIDTQPPIIDFLQETNLIRSVIDKIDELAEQVKKIHIEMLQAMANPKLEQELDDKTEEIKKLAYETSTRLKKMEQTQESRDDHDKKNAQWRIKESQIFVLTRRFRDTMTHYNQEAVSHRERCKKAIVRELEISGHKKSQDELEEILEGGSPGTSSFSILVDTQKSKQSLSEIEARHRDIIKLENSIKELHNMYRDLAMLVADQGEMIDSIEHNVSRAVDYVEDAAENVNIAEQYYKQAVKKKICIVIILIASVIMMLSIIFIVYFAQRKIRGR